MSRPETGPMQFGDDWPGVFIRGDDALGYYTALNVLLAECRNNKNLSSLLALQLEPLRDELHSCIMQVEQPIPPVLLKEFQSCQTTLWSRLCQSIRKFKSRILRFKAS